MVPVKVLVNFGSLLKVLWVPVVRKMVLVHEVSHNGSTVLQEEGEIIDTSLWSYNHQGLCACHDNSRCGMYSNIPRDIKV